LILEAINLKRDENLESEIPNLSRLTHSLSATLLYPPIIVASDGKEDRPLKSSMSFIDGPFACSHHLVNMRTLPFPDNFTTPSYSSLFILHNLGLACKVNENMNHDSLCHDQPSRKYATKFEQVTMQSINRCSLTGMHAFEHLNDLSNINVSPMQLEAFNVTFAK